MKDIILEIAVGHTDRQMTGSDGNRYRWYPIPNHKPMQIKNTGKTWVMFGSNPETDKWFERYYKTEQAAKDFAAKRGWAVASAKPAEVAV